MNHFSSGATTLPHVDVVRPTGSKPRAISRMAAGGFDRNLLLPILPHDATQGDCTFGVLAGSRGKAPATFSPETGKWRLLSGWQRGVSDPDLENADKAGSNAGLRLGAGPADNATFIFLDLDTEPDDEPDSYASVVADLICDVVLEALERAIGPVWARKTRPGRLGMLLSVASGEHPGGKLRISLKDAEQSHGVIEVLARGQQVVVAGAHKHNGGTPILWYRADRPKEHFDTPQAREIPVLPSRAHFDALLQDCIAGIERIGIACTPMTPLRSGLDVPLPPLTPEEQAAPSAGRLIDLLQRLPHGPDVDRDRWVNVMMACAGCLRALQALEKLHGQDEEEIVHAAVSWSTRWEDPRGVGTTYEVEREKWENDFSKSPADHVGWEYLEGLGLKAGVSGLRLAQAQEAFKADLAPSPIDGLIAEFNDRYIMVNEGGKAVIYAPGRDPVLNRNTLDRMAIADLRALYMNRKVQIGIDEKGRPVLKPVADVWLQHDQRHQYIHGVTFDPSPRALAPGVLNLWQGYAVKPKHGDWSLLRTHIRDVICSGNAEHFDYLSGWMARMIQRPAEQGEVAIVLKGGEGTGKGTLAKALLRIMGQHGMGISTARHLVGNFNNHLRDCIFLFADEAFFAGDKQHVGALKSLITEPYLTIEAKYANAVQMPNFLHVLMASNEEWVVPASLDARRFLVLEVPDTVKRDTAYFGAIWAQMEKGGYEAMLHDLLSHDLGTFNVRDVPITTGLHRQRKLSLDTTTAWWQECLERGFVFQSRLGLDDYFQEWQCSISTELLYASYEVFAKGRGARRVDSREELGKFMVKMNASPGRWRNNVVGEHMTDKKDPQGYARREAALIIPAKKRPTGYHLGSLDDAREAFVKSTKLAIVWDGGIADDGE